MKITKNHKKQTEKSIVGFQYYVLFSLLFALNSINSFSQDSIPQAKDLTEEKEINFQQFFFKALSEKAIGNHQKAIEYLESCNQVLTNNVAVYFEFSKNYLLLNKNLLAKEYINRALLKEPKNIWMLKHLVKIHLKDRNFSEAIPIQQRVAKINLKERETLVRIYLQNNNLKKAVTLLNVLEQENALSPSLKRLKNSLDKRKNTTEVAVKEQPKTNNRSLKDQFKNNKSFSILKQILEDPKNATEDQLLYANEGISLFPAQPFVYLIKAKALNYQKEYKKALLSLKDGIDFVIEDEMEANFYNEMAISYKALGDLQNEKKYIEKSKKLKK